MVLFVLRKLILQTRMRSHPVGLDVWVLVGPSPEPLLVACVIGTIISWTGSNVVFPIPFIENKHFNKTFTAHQDPFTHFLSLGGAQKKQEIHQEKTQDYLQVKFGLSHVTHKSFEAAEVGDQTI